MENKEKLEYTKQLMELFEKSDLASFEYNEGDFGVKFAKATEQVVTSKVVKQVEEVKETSEVAVEDCEVILSPIVGTYYQSPSPEAAPYVSVGDTVKKGQVLCIVEAMKVMNEITATCAGQITEILVEDSEGVEFNQPLFKIK